MTPFCSYLPNVNERMTVLYLSYDGLMEQLGQSQVLQYLKPLAKKYRIVLMTYEKAADWADELRLEKIRTEVNEAGIRWFPLRYHKSPSVPATSYDLAVGFWVGLYLILRYRVRVVHARSYVVSVLALMFKKILRVKFIFDMRGFWVDQRAELGIWNRSSFIFRFAKRLERSFLLNADAVVALSARAVEAMQGWPDLQSKRVHFQVIPTCVNLELFRPNGTIVSEAEAKRPFVLGYVGNARAGYLFDPVMECFKILQRRRPDARLLIVNRRDHAFIRERLAHYGIPEAVLELKAVAYEGVSAEIGRMNGGVFFYLEGPFALSSVPTRMGELLACGVPCLTNEGGAGGDGILEKENVGVVAKDLSGASLEVAIDRLLQLTSSELTHSRCVEVAHRFFSLERGVGSYGEIYERLGAR